MKTTDVRPADWDPDHYLTYADERGRPFVELVQRIGALEPRRVVDLGCGPGNLTRLLETRWPQADIVGLDSSPEMIAAATREPSGVQFEVTDLIDWSHHDSSGAGDAVPVDVLISNATLQWVPDHLELLPDLVARVRPGGWLAFQVPGNFGEPSHALLHELADQAPYAEHVAGAKRPGSHAPERYLDALTAIGCRVDAWETTYLHVLEGEDPVFTWISATGARPILRALPAGLRSEFERTYKERLRAAYPSRAGRVVLPFRRIFVVARVSDQGRRLA